MLVEILISSASAACGVLPSALSCLILQENLRVRTSRQDLARRTWGELLLEVLHRSARKVRFPVFSSQCKLQR